MNIVFSTSSKRCAKSTVVFLFLAVFVVPVLGQQQLKTPKEFLGYALGERFTRHHEMKAYYEHVAEASPNVKLIEYGITNEYRPLFVAVISSKKNMDNLETIRQDNLKRTGLLEGSALGDKVAIVWLSYNVHGNEASSLDASIKTIYELVNPANEDTKVWLENTVIIMDPCINPDGRERFVNHFYEKGNAIMNVNVDSKEHREPWPGGRANHYFFDLNRDWAWQTQVESQQRIALYNQWMPHVHVDFHEQYYNNPYYFAPAAKPFHEVITPWQREFQTTIGQNHAKYFDKEGWLYFTKEIFDLFYPSYGDTYPTYNGAIGMTYEQAGHTYAGRGVLTEMGDTLTLKDRLTHHFTTGLSTIEITSKNATKVVEEFEKYFTTSKQSPKDPYKSYVIKQGNADKMTRLLSWLDAQQIQYGSPSDPASLKGFEYFKNTNGTFSVNKDDVVIRSSQPKSALVQALFEPKSKLEDSLTYDITAWSVPYIYGLEAYATTQHIAIQDYTRQQEPKNLKAILDPYAYAFKYESLADVAFLSALLQSGIKVRVNTKPFSSDGNKFNRGTLLVMRRNNEGIKNLRQTIIDIANTHERTIYSISSGFVNEGSDLGASSYEYIKPPKVALLGGEKTSSLSFGEIWHYFDKEIGYPVTTIYTDYFSQVDLSNYDVLVIPDGGHRFLDDDTNKKLSEWVTNGGNLILVGSAVRGVADKEGFALTKYASEEEKKEAEKKEQEVKKEEALEPYSERERIDIGKSLFGAIYRVHLDNTHPLAYGYPNKYFTLKTSPSRYAYLSGGGNVGIIKSDKDRYSGFVGKQVKQQLEESLVFGVEKKGSGSIVYMVDNPLFRDFWENGKVMFANAVFMVY